MEQSLRKSVKVITPPAYEPVTLQEAKLWCRVEDDDIDDEATLLLLIIAMREYAEELTGRAFVRRTLELRLEEFPEGEIELPQAPLISVSSIQYVDGDGTLQTLDASPNTYQVDAVSEPGRVAPLYAADWPAARAVMDAVRIQYVAGYATVNLIPKKVRLWMQARISTLFENREQFVVGNIVQPIPRDFVDGLLDGLRVRRFFA
jgi:uncharacterized phiE125 gp8 family phage protein